MLKGTAVVVLCPWRPLQLVAISRGHDLHDWNLPGGKVEPGETFAHAAARELEEETGIRVSPSGLRPVADQVRHTGARSVTFVAQGHTLWPPRLQSVPWEGYVTCLSPERLVDRRNTYAEDNLLVLRRLGLLGGRR